VEYDSITEEDYMTGMSRELRFSYPSAYTCLQPTASQLPSLTRTWDSYSVQWPAERRKILWSLPGYWFLSLFLCEVWWEAEGL